PDLYGTQHVVPTANEFVQERVHIGATVPVEQPTRLFPPLSLSKTRDTTLTLACLQLNRQLQRGTGVETGSHLPGQLTSTLKRQRTLGSPIATQEFCAISCPRGLLSSKINKGDTPTKLAAQHTTREERPGLRIDLRNDVRRGVTTRMPKDPLGIGRDRKATRAAGRIL